MANKCCNWIRFTLAGFTILAVSTFTTARAALLAVNNLGLQKTTNGWEEVGLAENQIVPNTAKGQSFIATASGKLATIEALISAGIDDRRPNSPPLQISFYTAEESIPLARLATVQASALAFEPIFHGDDHLTVIHLERFSISIEAGSEYAVVFSCPSALPGPNGNYSPYLVGMDFERTSRLERWLSYSHDGGASWELPILPVNDIYFELGIRVTLPEPGTVAMLLLGVGLIVLSRPRSGRL
jgi:hypothetical protein